MKIAFLKQKILTLKSKQKIGANKYEQKMLVQKLKFRRFNLNTEDEFKFQ